MSHEDITFNLDGYLTVLTKLRDWGYQAKSFDDEPISGKSLLLRHDVDVSLQYAVEMAKIEGNAGWQSTYFVLLGSEFYNLFTNRSRRAISKIVEFGHEIGLHFDASIYSGDQAELDKQAQYECEILESIVGNRVEVIAAHRPDSRFLARPGKIAGRSHTYEPRFFTDIEYCSDSTGGWHRNHPLQNSAVNSGLPMQLLTHPYLWISSPDYTPAEKLKGFLKDQNKHIESELDRNFKFYSGESF
jgi:hypothetical protein